MDSLSQHIRPFPFTLTSFALLGLGLMQVSCKDPKENSYQVQSESSEAPDSNPAPMVWLPDTAPAGWEALETTGSPRVASYRIITEEGAKPVEMAVIPFPGTVGGLLANVNRWRGEVELPELTEEELANTTERREIDRYTLHRVDAIGAERRILGAILPLPGATWFFKISGPKAVVEKQSESFDSYLSQVKIDDSPAPSPAPLEPSATPPQLTGQPGGPDAAQAEALKAYLSRDPTGRTPHRHSHSTHPALTYTLPDGWVEGKPSMARAATFTLSDDDQRKVEIAIIPLAGSGGALLANVNQWRAMLQLESATQEQLPELVETVEVRGQEFRLVDFVSDATNENPNQTRLMVAFATIKDHSWFFKMVGDANLAAEQKPVLLKFLESVELEAAR
jgi:hypothetical protein